MNDPLEAEIAVAIERLQAVLPTRDDVRLDRRTRAVLCGQLSIENLVRYMRNHQKTPADILWKLGDMLDKHTPAEPAQPAAASVAAPAAKKVATRKKTAKKAKKAKATN